MRIFGTASALAYAQAVTVAVQLIQVPIFLFYWQKGLYGEWLVLTGFASTLVLLDFGVTKASESDAIRLLNEGNLKQASVVIHTAQAYVLGAITVLLAVLFITVLFDVPSLLGLSEIDYSQFAQIAPALFVNVAVSLQMGVVDAGFKLADRNAFGQFLFANRRIVNLFTTILGLYFQSDPAGVAILLAISDITYMLICMLILNSFTCISVFSIKSASKHEFTRIFTPAMGYVAFPTAQAITIQGGTQLLFKFAGAAEVVNFTLTRTLVRTVAQVGLVLNNAMKPEVSRLAGLKKFNEALAASRKLIRFSNAMSIGGYILLILLGPNILSLWSQGTVSTSWQLVALVGIHAVFYTLWIVPASVQMGLNKHSGSGAWYFFAAIVSLIAWIWFPVFPPVVCASLLLAIPEVVVWLFLNYSNRDFENDGRNRFTDPS